MNTQENRTRSFSFEFFPPRDEKQQRIFLATRDQLAQLNPEYFSVTFGAGGSTLEGTKDTVLGIQRDTSVPAAPHISCIGADPSTVDDLLQTYKAAGIRRLVALRGDTPSGGGSGPRGKIRYAGDLVAYIRKTTGDYFHIEVACYPEFHPEADDAFADLKNFKRKVDAGADAALTQYFFNTDAYFRFVDSCETMGIEVPIVPGVMPITNYKQLARFSDRCGADIPRWVRQRLQAYGDDMESLRSFGTDFVTDLCRRLLDAGAPGLHFYTLNRAKATLAIWDRLGLRLPPALERTG